jgi:CO dehydrogenase maturation factor
MASLVIRYLQRTGANPILAIDADPNANLGDSLGLKVGQTVGAIIAAFNEAKIDIPPGMTKEDYLEFQISDALTESKGLDLLTMGRGEGPECYCYPNLMLRRFADKLSESYAYVVMDNEAGMEHLSRRTTQNINELLLVSDHSVKGIRTIARLKELVSELELVVKRQSVVVNFVPDGIDPHISQEMERLGLELTATVPFDKEVYECDLNSKSLLELPDTAKAVMAVNNLMAKLLN